MASGNIIDQLTIGNPDSSQEYRDIMMSLLTPMAEGSNQRAHSPGGHHEITETQPAGAHTPGEARQDVPAEVQLNEPSLFVSENESNDDESDASRFLALMERGNPEGAGSLQAASGVGTSKGESFVAGNGPFESDEEETVIVTQSGPSAEDIQARQMVGDEPESEGQLAPERAKPAHSTVNFIPPDHVELNRPSYSLYEPGDDLPLASDPPKKGRRAGLDTEDGPYRQWPLYNEHSSISKTEKTSWPPQGVLLQDWHVWKILESGISNVSCHKYWPGDFNAAGLPYADRKPKGRAAKVCAEDSGDLHYVVACGRSGKYQLHGDEGGHGIKTPSNENTEEEPFKTKWYNGTKCLIQQDFHPSDQELLRGINISRYPSGQVPVQNKEGAKGRKRVKDVTKTSGGDSKSLVPQSKQTQTKSKRTDGNHNKPTLKELKPKPTKTQDKVVRFATPTSAGNMPSSSVGAAAPKRTMNEATAPSSKVPKKKKGSSAGASKRTTSSTKSAPASSGTESDGDTIRVAQGPKGAKKQGPRVEVPTKARLPSSPAVTSSAVETSDSDGPAESSTLSKESSPKGESGVRRMDVNSIDTASNPATGSLASVAAAGLATSSTEHPRITLNARRAELEKSKTSSHAAFWAAEAANLCNVMRDSQELVHSSLTTVTEALSEACQTQDVDESERLLAGVMNRVHELRVGFGQFVETVTNGVSQRAKNINAPELSGFEKMKNDYKAPEIGGSKIEDKIVVPAKRQPDESLFHIAAGPARIQRPRNPALVAALARMRSDTSDADLDLH